MPHLLLIPAVYLAALFDTAVVASLGIGAAAPDGLALVALAWSLNFAGPRGYLTTGVIGFVSDVLSPGRLGVGLACFSIVGYVLPRLREHLATKSPPTFALWAWPAATIMILGPAIVRRAWGEVELNCTTLVIRGLTVGASTAALTLPVLIVITWIRRTRRQKRWA